MNAGSSQVLRCDFLSCGGLDERRSCQEYGTYLVHHHCLFCHGLAVSEVGFIHEVVVGLERLLQHREGARQSSPLPGCRAHAAG
ncbi:hypothetical protein EYF80_060237 [Liparis tanakae]|uniref:Uncharacterized protein n=1 Tax=Liparis tanakae TaxID=230148 RepID=A0A4Z2EML4_9TELE|nr:hypothetical protein EYF80_060237 [Liparis tanakae]